MAVTVFRDKILVHGGFGFSPFGETGEGFCATYPPALPKWEGGWLHEGCDGFPREKICLRMFWLLPLGGDGRGVLWAEEIDEFPNQCFA